MNETSGYEELLSRFRTIHQQLDKIDGSLSNSVGRQ